MLGKNIILDSIEVEVFCVALTSDIPWRIFRNKEIAYQNSLFEYHVSVKTTLTLNAPGLENDMQALIPNFK